MHGFVIFVACAYRPDSPVDWRLDKNNTSRQAKILRRNNFKWRGVCLIESYRQAVPVHCAPPINSIRVTNQEFGGLST
jgi:hypothetical protein